jgi:transposase
LLEVLLNDAQPCPAATGSEVTWRPQDILPIAFLEVGSFNSKQPTGNAFEAVNQARHRAFRWIVEFLSACGKWYVSVQTEREAETNTAPFNISGGHGLGRSQLRNPVSDGEVVEQCQPLKKFLPKLAQLQRRMAGKKKLSKNCHKAKACISNWHAKVANGQKGFPTQGLER